MLSALLDEHLFLFFLLVTMQVQKEAPLDMQCKDKFLLQSVVAEHGTTTKDITPEMVANFVDSLFPSVQFKFFLPSRLIGISVMSIYACGVVQ